MEPTPTGHIVLCGLDRLGYRTLEELQRLGEVVVVVAEPGGPFNDRALKTSARVVTGDYREEATLRAAGLASATAIVITSDDDVGNLHAALAAQDINPSLRLVVRMFNLDFGRRVEQLFADCAVLSSSAIAAPAFVAAAIRGGAERSFTVGSRDYVVRQAEASSPDVVIPLIGADGGLFPESGQALSIVADETHSMVRKAHRHRDPFVVFRTLAALADRRLLIALGALSGIATLSIIVFVLFDHLDLIDSLYFTVTVITTTGFGDISLRDAEPPLKLYGIALMLVGASTVAVVYALLTDLVVGARLARVLGSPRRQLRDHIIVCGLGSIGYRVAEQLARAGYPVVAVERDETNRFVATVRRLGVPVVLADARLPETLHSLGVARARCVAALTDDDLANLETALNAQDTSPKLSVVLRIFDPDFAARVERTFAVHLSRSVAALAAPLFAAAAIGRQVLTTIPAGGHVLIVAESEVAPGSTLDGSTVERLERVCDARLLELASQGLVVEKPPRDTVLRAGDRLIVVATRRGLAALWQMSTAPTR